jgi:small subunit ribosomal protein S7e
MSASYQPHLRKLRKAKRAKPSELETSVAQALMQLELSHKALGDCLPRFHFNTAKEFEHPLSKKKGLLVLYPLRFVMLVRKVQKTLVAELEKRFPGRAVMLVAQRKVVKRPNDVYKLQEVQRSRTATAVNESILEDLIYPADIVARRWRFRTDGSRVMKVFLDSRAKAKLGGRLNIASYLYKKLTKRVVQFGFMWNPRLQQISHK